MNAVKVRRLVLKLGLVSAALAAAVAASLFLSEYQRASAQHVVVAQLVNRNCKIIYDWEWDYEANTPREPRFIRRYVFDDLAAHVLIVSCPELSDSELELIVQIPDVIEIDPPRSVSYRITDRGLKNIGRLKHLRYLPSLRSESITDEGISFLSELPELQSLSIAGHISDDGLAKLARMNSLKVLEITSPDVTDTGVSHFRATINLNRFYLGGQSISDEAIRSLRKANDGLIVEYRPEQF